MKITSEMFDPIPLDVNELAKFQPHDPLSGGFADGLLAAIENGTISDEDRGLAISELEKYRSGSGPIDPFPGIDSTYQEWHDPRLTVLETLCRNYSSTPARDALAKRAKIDPSKLHLGMKVKGFAGNTGKIQRIRNGAVDIEYDDGGSGTTLIDYVEAMA